MATFLWHTVGILIMATPTQSALFPELDSTAAEASPTPKAAAGKKPRLRLAERCQVVVRYESLDQRLPADHLARDIWRFVEGLDLSPLYETIQAVEGSVGRHATDPKILMAVWLYAITQKQGSARAVAKLCEGGDHAYEWLCGSVTLNYHTLADFRVEHGELLDDLFTQSLAALMAEGLVDLKCTAQDGMRVRASAGTSSFRRRPTLEQCLKQAKAHVDQLKQELDADSTGPSRRERAARERAVRERQERVQAALQHVQEVAAHKEARKKGDGEQARASTTDAEASTMKMPDGGFRPAYNVQLTTAVGSGVIVGVDVVNQGTDAGLMDPMVAQIEERTGQTPQAHLTDGGFSTLEDIEKVSRRGTTVYTPVKEEKAKKQAGMDPFAPRPKDSKEAATWRQRMGTEEGKAVYKLRAQTAELSNAQARNRGLYSVNVRGLAKVRMIAVWYALVHNLMVGLRLRAERAAQATTSSAVTALQEG